MPVDPVREAEVREQTEKEFAAIESGAAEVPAGTVDVLRVYGGLELALRQADAYLSLLNPRPANFSTSSSSNL